MSVYTDVQALQDMFEYCYDAETGEVDEGAEKQLAEYKAEILSADLEKLCKVRVNLMAKAEAIKAEKERACRLSYCVCRYISVQQTSGDYSNAEHLRNNSEK